MCFSFKNNFGRLNQPGEDNCIPSTNGGDTLNLEKTGRSRTESFEDPESTSGDSDSAIFPVKSSSDSMFPTQSQPSMSEREKELDLQFEVCLCQHFHPNLWQSTPANTYGP